MKTDNISIQNGIQNPDAFYIVNSSWADAYRYYNLWSMNNILTNINGNAVTKTIYDPCPVGFHLPASNAFTGFTTTGNNAYNLNDFNVSGNWSNGWNFNNKFFNSDATLYFYPSGCLIGFASLYGADQYGYYWLVTLSDAGNGCFLYFGQSDIYPHYINTRSGGRSVCPVAEYKALIIFIVEIYIFL